jgi:hypothetical protein
MIDNYLHLLSTQHDRHPGRVLRLHEALEVETAPICFSRQPGRAPGAVSGAIDF